jgi:hypothetical protein
MRKSLVFVFACLLTTSVLQATEPGPADQKWLQAVQKMVTKGETKVTTPNEERVSLVKDWAEKNGYAVKVSKTGNSFTIEFASKDSSKTVAQK